jgi:hypothetical protein
MLGWKLNGTKLEYQVICRGEGKIVGVEKKISYIHILWINNPSNQLPTKLLSLSFFQQH